MIAAGELREKIAIQRPVRAANDSGGGATVYNDLLDTLAKVTEKASDPFLIGGQEQILNGVEFVIRYRPDVAVRNGDRILWRGNVFTINSIKVDPLRTAITIISVS